MRVKLRTMYSGPRGNCGAGCVIDLPDNEAQGLIDGGYAEAEIAEAVEPLAPDIVDPAIPGFEPPAPVVEEPTKNPGGWMKKGRR